MGGPLSGGCLRARAPGLSLQAGWSNTVSESLTVGCPHQSPPRSAYCPRNGVPSTFRSSEGHAFCLGPPSVVSIAFHFSTTQGAFKHVSASAPPLDQLLQNLWGQRGENQKRVLGERERERKGKREKGRGRGRGRKEGQEGGKDRREGGTGAYLPGRVRYLPEVRRRHSLHIQNPPGCIWPLGSLCVFLFFFLLTTAFPFCPFTKLTLPFLISEIKIPYFVRGGIILSICIPVHLSTFSAVKKE